ncbi:hypothetical protein [Chryseobacterium sp. YIM B08800]|uniref:hypothetical protein n=1 Tax=Chryseobacterium sp. YIM B08800 TaxID=2984136 RepID=UPI002240D4D0|nr:hypothetical protein [Chryseobacterium sp. YIM B08800]
MIKNNYLTMRKLFLFLLFLTTSFSYLSAQTGPNDDFDNDGIINSIDLDDDNDGVPDAVESPGCFYTATEANAIVTVRSSLTSPDDDQSDGDIQILHDGSATLTFNYNAGQAIAGASLLIVEYPTSVRLAQLSFINGTTFGAGVTARLEGSQDGLVWTDLGNGNVALSNTTNPKVFPNTNTGKFKYYRVLGTAGGNTVATTTIGEVNSVLAAGYNPSAYPKMNCASDSDGDSSNNHQDLDSDGDSCSDALEAGATTSTMTNFQFTGAVGINGLADAVETAVDSGTVNYTSTYLAYAVNQNISACLDSDGDGIPDVIDIDDDNDGVLDVVEMGRACGEAVVPVTSSIVVSPTGGWGSPDYTVDNSGMIGIGLSAITNGHTTTGNAFYFKEPSTTATITYNLSQNAILDNVVLWTPESFNYGVGDGPLKDFTVTLTYNGGQTYTSAVFTTVRPTAVDGPVYAQVFNLGQSFSNVTAIRLNILNGWTDQTTNSGSGAALDNTWVSTDGNVMDATYNMTLGEFRYGCSLQDIDTDGDGIPNRLDLDSDGDGCPDAKEAILFTNSSVATIPGTVKNGSGGVVTSTTANVPNAMVPGPYGSNGFADAIQSATNPDAYMYNYTYNFLATVASNNPCKDSDGDGMSDFAEDIDVDNDGIPNAIESPSCFFTQAQAMIITDPVTSDFNWNVTNNLALTYDQSIATYGQIGTSANIQNKALVTFDLPFVGSAVLASVSLNVRTAFGTGTWQLEGLSAANVWTPLSTAQAMNSATTFTFNNTLAPNAAFHTYRIKGVTSVVSATNAALNEFTVQYNNYQASLHPVTSGCNSDTDGDGVPNFQDRDSDGDGCPDAVEANVGGTLIDGEIYNTSTGNVIVPKAVVQGPYGANGLADSVETPSESGILNYTNTYNIYAINANINACTDTDGDGIRDVFDIDDDNDGILDTTEEVCSASITSKSDITVSIPSTISYTLFSPRTLPNLVDDNASLAVLGVPTGTLNNSEWFRVQFATPRVLTEWEVAHVTNQRVFSAASTYKVQGSVDGNNWVDLTGTLSYLNNGTGQGANSSSNIATFTQNNNPYLYYRYFGISGASGGGYATEFYFREKNCTDLDTDGDGIPNRLDLDSDGDGCSDALEAGATTNTTANYQFTGTMGVNGLADSLESPVDSGIINYASTYNQYALLNHRPLCLDTDNDGINNVIDIDDDNDGILDAVEARICGTATNPFTSLEQARATVLRAGIYYFNLSGSTFSTYVDTNGYVLIGVDYGDGTPALPTLSSLGLNKATYGRGLLSTAALANLGNIETIRISSNTTVLGGVDVTSTNATLINRVKANQSLHRGTADNTINSSWVGTGSGYFTVAASGSATAANNLNSCIINIAGNTASFNWIPQTGNQMVRYATGEIPAADYFALWVRGNTSGTACVDIDIDTDNDGIPDRLDHDSDNDGCSDAWEAGVISYITANGGTYTSGTLNNPSASTSPYAIVGNNTPSSYGANGFYTLLENNDTASATYNGTYTYANALNESIATCSGAFYKPAVTAGTVLDTKHGITSLQRAGADDVDNWPMVRKGAWTALESKTKGFVPNRLTITQINAIPSANLREGMMVYNITSDCLYINTDGTPTGWKCFNTQACP